MAEEITHKIDSRGSLYFLANAFIGAYNRRTDAIVYAAKVVAYAISGGQEASDLDELKALIDKADAELNKPPQKGK